MYEINNFMIPAQGDFGKGHPGWGMGTGISKSFILRCRVQKYPEIRLNIILLLVKNHTKEYP
jgi:hypothetical protein